jgi:hypothetical protein
MGPNGGSMAIDSDRNSAKNNYLLTYDSYGPVHNRFHRGECITWASGGEGALDTPGPLNGIERVSANIFISPTHLVEEPSLFVKVGELALVDDIGRHHLLQLPLLGGRHPGHLLLCPDK